MTHTESKETAHEQLGMNIQYWCTNTEWHKTINRHCTTVQ